MLPALAAWFLLGLLLGSQLHFVPTTIFVFLVGLAVGSSLLERAGYFRPSQAVLLYGSLLGGICYWTVTVSSPLPIQLESTKQAGFQEEITGRISQPVQHAPGRQTIVIEPEGIADVQTRLRLVWRDPSRTLYHGDRISVRARFHRPGGLLNLDGFDWEAHLARRDIGLVATVTGEGAIRLLESGAEDWRWRAWSQLDHWRGAVRDAAAQTIQQPALGLFLGIIIGDRGLLRDDLQEWFMATGTVHLLSISGSHLGLIALMALWSIKRAILLFPSPLLLWLSKRITATRFSILATWPVVALYACLAGAELATMRSLIMITLGLAAMWIGLERRLYHAVAAAALVIVLHDPRALFDISFQLSFLSVVVMIQAGWWISYWRENDLPRPTGLVEKLAGHGRDLAVMSTVVTLATVPLVALYFNQVSWMGGITNLLAIPYTGVVLVPLGLLAAAWTLLTSATGLVMGEGLQYLLMWMIDTLRWCAELPGAEWHVAAPSLPALVLFYISLLACCARRSPIRMRFVGGALVVCLVGWWILSPRVGMDGDRWRVTFLDVGQGDSAVLELPDGRTILVDGGARYERLDMGHAVVAPFLWNRGIRHLDHVLGTHQQADHVGGLIWLLRHLSVGQYWGTGIERPIQFVRDLNKALNDRRLEERVAVRGDDIVRAGPCRFTVLNPARNNAVQPSVSSHSGTLLNNRSIATRLQCGIHSILFAADIEVAGLQALDEEGRRAVTVLKVPHHGARSSLDRSWLGQLHPRYAVISVGRDNPYGHPVSPVLQAYEDLRVILYRTDRDGAVWITGRLSGSDIQVTRMRDLLPQSVDFWNCGWHCERQNLVRFWRQFCEHSMLPVMQT